MRVRVRVSVRVRVGTRCAPEQDLGRAVGLGHHARLRAHAAAPSAAQTVQQQ